LELSASGWRATRPALHPWHDPRRPEVLVLDVLESDRHHLACAVDLHLPEELQPEARRKIIGLFAAASFLEYRAWAKSVVERLRPPGAGMDRTGNEFPERLEVLEHRRVGIVIVSGGVVHIGGQPDGVTDACMLDEGEKVGNLD